MVQPQSNLREMLVKYSAPCLLFRLSGEEISGSGMLGPYVVLMWLQHSDLHAAVSQPQCVSCIQACSNVHRSEQSSWQMVKSKSLDDIAITFESILFVIQEEDWTLALPLWKVISRNLTSLLTQFFPPHAMRLNEKRIEACWGLSAFQLIFLLFLAFFPQFEISSEILCSDLQIPQSKVWYLFANLNISQILLKPNYLIHPHLLLLLYVINCFILILFLFLLGNCSRTFDTQMKHIRHPLSYNIFID